MLAGEFYLASDAELTGLRLRARQITRAYNATTESEDDLRRALLNRLFGKMGAKIEVEPPFRCDYGCNIYVGQNFYANFGVVMLDVAEIRIGDDVLLAPNVQLYTASHPLDPQLRRAQKEFGLPITIGDNVWIGGGAIVLPGVSIGDNAVIGAGSIVTRDVPANVVVAGNPGRIVRDIGNG